jgi:uncharacterized membrane protein YccC
MLLPRPILRLPAHVINGLGVALGIGLIQILIGGTAGHAAALTASSAAVCTSLADVPLAPHRSWHRVLSAALLASVVGVLTLALRDSPLLLGLFIALTAFCSALALAWGPRAGPLSFVGILAFVFTMAAPEGPWLPHALWSLLGAALYIGWAVALSRLLQPAYRVLALASVLSATADLLRSRAALLAEAAGQPSAAPTLQARIRSDAALEERLQAARDLLFAARDDAPSRRQTTLLLLAIDLRDTLQASELDLDLLGRDALAERVRSALGANLNEIAAALDAMHDTLRAAPAADAVAEPGGLLASLGEPMLPADDARARLLPVLLRRAQHMIDDVRRMREAMQADDAQPPLQREQLQLFVSVEGWPLAALRRHGSLRSPMLRHALRAAAALGSAYFLARLLPWASHPHWLVLSVAVVLRGNLEQTLSRRNQRVAGTVIGCLLVLALGAYSTPLLSALVFLVAVAIAHSFVMQRYLVTAAAATVMALLQAHLAEPQAGFAIPERLADTLLGALLAWGFSYVLPAWEKGGLVRTVVRLTRAQSALAQQVLRWPQGAKADVELRLARREVYDALGSVAAVAQRTSAEPQSVQVPLYALAGLMASSHALLAHLAAVKLMLTRRASELDRSEADAALRDAAAEVAQRLAAVEQKGVVATDDPDARPLPAEPADDVLMPWLHRRLQLTAQSAAQVAQTARALCTVAKS